MPRRDYEMKIRWWFWAALPLGAYGWFCIGREMLKLVKWVMA